MTRDWAAPMIIALARSGEPVQFRVRGGSMWPAVRSGARVELTPCPVAALEVGGLAAYERGGQVVVHRLVGKCGDMAAFAGDATSGPDELVPVDDVLGRVSVVDQRRLRLRVPTLRRVWLLGRHVLRAVRSRVRPWRTAR